MTLPEKLCFQISLPDDYKTSEEFAADMEQLVALGVWGVEVNIAHPTHRRVENAVEYFERQGLKLSMFASGLTARTLGLSLSSPNDEIRDKSVAMIVMIMDMVQEYDAGVILGLIKGGVDPNPEAANERFRRSLEKVLTSSSADVPILVEATNRYETSVVHTYNEGRAVVPDDDPRVSVLLDTFHMNIEEQDMCETLGDGAGQAFDVHLSDNNRRFPGLGSIAFEDVFRSLIESDYDGRFAVEGDVVGTFKVDASRSAERLSIAWMKAHSVTKKQAVVPLNSFGI